MVKETLKMVAVSGVVSLAVSLGVLHSIPATQARTSDAHVGALAPSKIATEQARPSAAGAFGGSTSVRDVYSDNRGAQRGGW